MKATIEINLDNAGSKWSWEVARILHEVARKVEEDGAKEFYNIYDINGNHVGELKITASRKG